MLLLLRNKSRHIRKPAICICQNKGADQLCSYFVFATQIKSFLCYLYPKFQGFIIFLRQYRPVCVGPDRKPKLLVFSLDGSKCFQSLSSVSSRTATDAGPSLIDMGHPAPTSPEGFADFADFQSANAANGDFNPRSQSQSRFISG